jgi:hypothetical protein
MMEHQYEKALRLYILNLMDSLSPEEEAYIHRMLADDVVFRDIWFSLEKESHNLNTTHFPDCIAENIQRKKMFSFRKMAAVAVVLELVFVFVRKHR